MMVKGNEIKHLVIHRLHTDSLKSIDSIVVLVLIKSENINLYYNKMSSQKNAIVMGSIFFVFSLAFCVISEVVLLTNDRIDWTIVWSIAFGIGAFTNLFLVFGAWKKNIGAI